MELRTEHFFLSITSDYWPHLVVGVLLVGAGAFSYIRWREGLAAWGKIFHVIEPSLQATASPIDQTATGCAGLAFALLNAFLTLLFLSLAVDQLLLMGWLWERIRVWLSGQFPLM
ncbi:MAG: hypothetical protein KDE19_04590 [Caldilineaceae bacterium]|nr:hypothetical protein [Caldilineaceae bacterium]